MSPSSYMIDIRLIPNEDHHLIIQNICNSAFSPGAIRSYTNAHRLGLGALLKSNASLLEIPIHQRYKGYAAHLIVTTLSDRLHPIDVISTSRQIRHVAELLTGIRFPEFDAEILRIQADAAAVGPLVRPGRERKAVILDQSLSDNYKHSIERLRHGKRKDGLPLASSVIKGGLVDFSLFLGVLDRANVSWRDMEISELIQKMYFDILADEWCPSGKEVSRINKLVHVLKIMIPTADFSCVSALMAELRAKAPGSMKSKGVKWNIPLGELPEEEAERFAFACPEYASSRGMTIYSPNEVDFDYNGNSIELEKKAAREVSQESFLAALRAMISELRISAPEQLEIPIDDRDYALISRLFYDRYRDYQPASLAARMESLLGLLRRILPEKVNIATLIDLTKTARNKVERKPVTVPNLEPACVRDQALVFIERSFRRAQDLRQCEKPYMDPEQHLLLFRDSLMIAFLAMEPLRRSSMRQLDDRDLGDIEIDEEIFFHARIDKSRMKNKEEHDFVIDRMLDRWIRLYLGEVRALIAPSYDGPGFWVSTFNTRLSNSTIGVIVRKTSLLITGVELKPHDFRRLVGTSEIATGRESKKLTHTSLEMTQKYQDSIRLLEVCRDSSLKAKGSSFWD